MNLYKNILTLNSTKTIKGEKLGYLTGILYLSPATIIKGINICKFASKGCKAACLYTAGRGKFNNVQKARRAKTELFRDNLNVFMMSIVKDIKRVIRKAKRDGMTPVIRLNGTSDIRWEHIRNAKGKNIFEMFPKIQFYDYTKDFKRVDALIGKWNNYHLTFSRSESKVNQAHSIELLRNGVNVAIVFNKIPKNYRGYEVINGDENDLRFLDKKGVIVGLSAKGDAKKNNSGFVIQINTATDKQVA